jgi:hypothetical protein
MSATSATPNVQTTPFSSVELRSIAGKTLDDFCPALRPSRLSL